MDTLYKLDNASPQKGTSTLFTNLQRAKNAPVKPGLSPSPSCSQAGFPVSALREHVRKLVPEAMLQHPEQMAESILVETVGLLKRRTGALLSSVLNPQKVNELVKAVSKIADEKKNTG